MEIKKFGGMLEVVRKNPITHLPAPNFNDANIKKISNAINNIEKTRHPISYRFK